MEPAITVLAGSDYDVINNITATWRADAVLVGAGSGMSSAAGYNHYHCNEMFKKYFKDFEQTYGIRNLLIWLQVVHLSI